MQLLESLFDRSPILGQLFSFVDMATPTQPTTATIAPTPPPSQHADGQCSENQVSTLATSTTPATPVSPPEITRPRKRRRIINRITRPEPGSLYDIMHEHCGEALFIIPICWTDMHARLLDIQFIDRGLIRKPVPDFNTVSSKYPPRPTMVATELSKDLTTILKPEIGPLVAMSIKNVMRTFFPATLFKTKSSVDLELRFGDHVLKRAVRVAVLWQHPDSDSTSRSFDSAATRPASSYGRIPSSSRESGGSQGSDWTCCSSSQPSSSRLILAFVNSTHLKMVRRNLYRIAPGPTNGDRANTPVANLQRLRCKRLVPDNPDHDSYLAAIMLAMAQSQCYPPSSKSSSRASSQRSKTGPEMKSKQPRLRDVPVKILSQINDTAEFVVYSAVVSASFLGRFSCPTKAPDMDDLEGGLQIEVTKVPIWPVLGLKERLAKAFGAEIAGEACSQLVDGEIDTWETEQERNVRLGSLKRRREALCEVFTRSFESNDGETSSSGGMETGLGITVASPPPSPRTPKRRRTQSISELEVC